MYLLDVSIRDLKYFCVLFVLFVFLFMLLALLRCYTSIFDGFIVLSAEIIQVSYSAWVRCPCSNVCNLEEESKPPSTVFRYQSSRSSKSQKNQFFNNNKINQKILLLLFLTMFALFLMIPCFITSVDFDSKLR